MDASNPGELIHDTCPVCGEVRTGYSNLNLMICRNYYCPVQNYLIPKGIETRLEAITYAGWLPDKTSTGRDVYFNPRFAWFNRHFESVRRDNERKSLIRNLITGLVGMNNEA